MYTQADIMMCDYCRTRPLGTISYSFCRGDFCICCTCYHRMSPSYQALYVLSDLRRNCDLLQRCKASVRWVIEGAIMFAAFWAGTEFIGVAHTSFIPSFNNTALGV